MEEEREGQNFKKTKELKDNQELHERFVKIFSDVDKNNPINIDINKEAWPIFLKVVEDYSQTELMNAPDSEIVKNCISVKEIFFGQKNIITDGNGNPNIAANIKANPNFIEQNPEVVEVLDNIHPNSKISMLFAEKDDVRFFNAFLRLNSNDIDSMSQDELDRLVTEKGYTIFSKDGGKTTDKDRCKSFAEAMNIDLDDINESKITDISENNSLTTNQRIRLTLEGIMMEDGEEVSYEDILELISEMGIQDIGEKSIDGKRTRDVLEYVTSPKGANLSDEEYAILISGMQREYEETSFIDMDPVTNDFIIGNFFIPYEEDIVEDADSSKIKMRNGMKIIQNTLVINGMPIPLNKIEQIFMDRNKLDISLKKIRRLNERDATFNRLGGEELLKENYTDEQFNTFTNIVKGEVRYNNPVNAFTMNDNSIDVGLYANKDAEFRYIQFAAEYLSMSDIVYDEKGHISQISLQDGTIVTLDGITLKDGTMIPFKTIKTFMKENSIDQNLRFDENGISLEDGKKVDLGKLISYTQKQNQTIQDGEARKFVESSSEELDASAIYEFQRKTAESKLESRGAVSSEEIINSKTERIDTSLIDNVQNRIAGDKTKQQEVEQFGQDINPEDRIDEEYEPKKKSLLSRIADIANKAINGRRKENSVDTQTTDANSLTVYNEKKSLLSGIINRFGISKKETSEVASNAEKTASADENIKTTNRFSRFLSNLTGKSEESRNSAKDETENSKQDVFEQYQTKVNTGAAIEALKVSQKNTGQRENREEEK